MEYIFSKEFEKYKDLWNKATNHNDKDAQYELACKLKKSKNKKIRKTVFDLFTKAARNDHIRATYECGLCYETGYGVKQNYSSAIVRYKDVDDLVQGSVFGVQTAASHRDDLQVAEYLEDPHYKSLLDLLTDDRNMTKKPYDELLDFAMSGDAEAQYELGIRCYYGTRDTKKDTKAAEQWWLSAAEQEHEYAIHSLAEKYLFHRRPEEAAKWYRKYAEMRIKWQEHYFND